MAPDRLSRPLKLGYGVGSLGTGIYSVVPGLLLLFFLTDVLAVPAATAGLVILLPKIWDVVIDPYIGTFSDRLRTPLGNRRPLMLAGGVLLPIFFALLFSPPEAGPGATAVIMTVMFVLAATGFSLFQVPYIALPADLTDDPHDRTRLIAYRMVALTLGILLGGGLAPLVVDLGGGDRAGYRLMGTLIGITAGSMMLASTFGVRSGRVAAPAEHTEGVSAQLRRAWRNRPFSVLLSGYFLQNLAVNVMLAGSPFLALYLLGDEALTSLLFVALVAPAAVLVPVWARISFRLGKLATFRLAVVGYAVVALTLLTAGPDRVWLALVQAGLLGAFYAGTQLLPFSMLPDAIDVDTAGTGTSRAGGFTGLWTAGETVGAALGPAIFAAVLASTGFIESTGDVVVDQPSSAIDGIRWGFAALPALLLLTSIPILNRYHTTQETGR